MDPLSIALAVALGFAVFAFGVLVGSLVSTSRQRKKAAVASMQDAMHPQSPTVAVPADATPEGAQVVPGAAATGGLQAMSPPDPSTRVAGEVESAAPVPPVELPGYQLSSESAAGVDALLPSVADVPLAADATAEATPAPTVPSVVDQFAMPELEHETIAEPVQSSAPESEIAWDFAAEPEFELDAEVASALGEPLEPMVMADSEQPSTPAPEIVWEVASEPEPAQALEAPSPVSEFAWELPPETPAAAEPDTTPSASESGLTWVTESEPTLPPVFESPEATPATDAESELAWLLEPETPVEPEPATFAEAEPVGPAEAEPTASFELETAMPAEPELAVPAEPEPAMPYGFEPMTSVEPEPAIPAEPEPAMPAEPEPAMPAEPMTAAPYGFEPMTPVEPAMLPEPEPGLEPGLAPDWPVVMEPASVQGAVPDAEFAWAPPQAEAVAQAEPAPIFSAPVDQAMEIPSLPIRPRAHVRAIPEGPAVSAAIEDSAVPREAPSALPARTENLDMIAPVQMWFGDYAVAVKAGSKTHAQFKKYADVLLDELRDAGEHSR